ncbi:hypothetical protein Srot_0751 [Segniliparus rotundus DSM 44985]|uniref:Transmembrane protein n=1 Tax=Segniliparus rotundus (strain ATCC BAA-972 / CDC 1076 / CIP 108378 / DSM 44985 / JCM 13578) TaxID=640132 RepID=D6ZDG7_SEGRD|nr:hypothetical protein [Segniliparus rotundus]ADG97231.1 hypothetical protein Srot_0751 [Segniliparus rotundus DSM 44985]
MKIAERIRGAADSLGPRALWILVAVAAADALCGAFLATDFVTGALVFDTHPHIRPQMPWLFILALTVAIAAGAGPLLRSSETMWRSWLLRIGVPVALMSVVIFLVADAQATSFAYVAIRDDGTAVRPAYPYLRAVFAAFSLLGQFALLVRFRRNDN